MADKNKNNVFQSLLIILVVIMAFFSGTLWMKLKNSKQANNSQTDKTPASQAKNGAKAEFKATKSKKPEAKFFVMSFCPYGNQAEEGLSPVYQLLKNKVNWQPRYVLYDKTYCNNMVYDEKKCQGFIDAGKVKDLATCKKYFPFKTIDDCAQKYCLQGGSNYYCSMHGLGEVNQDIREMCVYNNSGVDSFWQFVTAINKKCNAQNVETCWSGVAQDLKLDVNQISQCQKEKGVELLKKEMAESAKYKVRGSPTVYFNDVLYNGGRQPEDYKQAICASFEKQPKECKTVLSSNGGNKANGGCE